MDFEEMGDVQENKALWIWSLSFDFHFWVWGRERECVCVWIEGEVLTLGQKESYFDLI